MAKRSKQADEQPAERSWYTVGWKYLSPVHGAVGGSLEVYATDKMKAQAIVEAKLQAKGSTWKEITIVKGRDPRLTWSGGRDRYAAELQSMIGRLHLNATGPDTPSPIWVHGDPTHDPDATARTMWAKFMDESSHGLAVSDFPRFVICDVNGYPTLPLPSEAVKDETRWDGITAVVREILDYWKATLQERIERLGKVKRRSAEDTDQLKRDKAALKALEAFDGWNYQRYVEQLLPGRKPHPLDLDNRRLYRLSNGQLIPVSDLGTFVLRVDFWRRLLEIWERPVNVRGAELRAFLDHHHMKGGKPEAFRDLVDDTAKRLHDAAKRMHDAAMHMHDAPKRAAQSHLARKLEQLGDKLREWHTSASAANSLIQHRAEVLTPAGLRAFIRSLIAEGGKLETRATKVDALLNGHLGRDYSEAFVEFIRGNVLEWKAEAASHRPPPDPLHQFAILRGFARGWLRVDSWLIDRCERWLAEVDASKDERKKAPASNPSKWPDLKSLALFHAYRFEAGDKEADLGTMDAAKVAAKAGFTAKSSGKELQGYFTRYALTPNRKAERMEHGRAGDIRKRLAIVVTKLNRYPKALAIAEAEAKELRDKANEE